MAEITSIEYNARAALDAANEAREKSLAGSRVAIRHCANAIRAVHRGDFVEAESLMSKARSVLAEADGASVAHPEVRYAGFLSDARKELAEAAITFALVKSEPLPDLDQVGVGVVEYLGGLAEAVGELRRHLLDTLRKGDVDRGEAILARMDEIYALLVSMDYPDALTRGLRSRTDAARGIIERSRSDLTMTAIQHELAESLKRTE